MKKILALLLAALLLFGTAGAALAASAFVDGAYATVLTASDFQDSGAAAYERFGRLLGRMKDDGMPTPHSMLVGGDYTKLLFDYAVPGISLIREELTGVYPDADPETVVCVQGNHDNPSSGFAKTGLYDMGAYNLYVINEDDFPWLQTFRIGLRVREVAKDMEKKLDVLIEKGDLRPVIVLTHLPLHHSSRILYGDNKYAGLLFDVLNRAGEALDVVFLFGHQHSGDYDDYIGGSVNFMAPGDAIRVPRGDLPGEGAFTEETLTFTYLNCGYVGYSDNGLSGTSTNVLTLGAVQFTENSFHFVKYTEDGVWATWDVARRNTGSESAGANAPTRLWDAMWKAEKEFFERFLAFMRQLLAFFKN